MSSTAETGHAKNVALFEEMLGYCIGYNKAYQPSKESLQIGKMQQLLEDAQASLRMVTEQLTAYRNAKNARIEAFKDIKTRISRVVNGLAAIDVDDKTLEDARAILRKIRGIRVSKKEDVISNKEPVLHQATTDVLEPVSDAKQEITDTKQAEASNNKTTRYHSSAQTSRDQQIEHVARLLALLQTVENYQPNEEDLKLSALQQYLDTLRSTNSAVLINEVKWSNARICRNALLYEDKASIYHVAKGVKLYVKSAFGLNSPWFKQISGLKFTKPR